jgi:hypothetical protein
VSRAASRATAGQPVAEQAGVAAPVQPAREGQPAAKARVDRPNRPARPRAAVAFPAPKESPAAPPERTRAAVRERPAPRLFRRLGDASFRIIPWWEEFAAAD